MSAETNGRLHATLLPEAQRIVQQPGVEAALGGELRLALDIDRAHLVMLDEQRLLPPGVALALLDAVDELDRDGFAALRGRPAPRGWYLMYEGYLTERLGPTVAGWLPTGRSRNDLSATLAQLKLRRPYEALLRAAVRLQLTLLRRARQHLHTVMPGFTHGQPALPITFGHYLAAVAHGLDRDLDRLVGLLDDLAECPLGAGAMGGTTLPIDPARTADLLGFVRPAANSLSAVANRDTAARLLGDAQVLATRLSRVATDLRDWTSATPPLLRLPDSLVGSSSMMPQKRNVYLLEHIQGMAAAPLGAASTLAAASQKTPFSNSISVHGEGPVFADTAIEKTAQAATLLRLLIQHADPDRSAMRQRAEGGMTYATELANRLALSGGRGFRLAHREIGAAAASAAATGRSLLAEIELPDDVPTALFDVGAVAEASRFGGGPAAEPVAASLEPLAGRVRGHVARARAAGARWAATPDRIRQAVGRLRAEQP